MEKEFFILVMEEFIKAHGKMIRFMDMGQKKVLISTKDNGVKVLNMVKDI